MSLAVRAQADELMDADDLDVATYTAVVGDLAQVNVVTMAGRATLAFLDRVLASNPQPVRAEPVEALPFSFAFQEKDSPLRLPACGSRSGQASTVNRLELLPAVPSRAGGSATCSPGRPEVRRLKILDVGFGDGDMLRRIARWSDRRGVEVELVGVDLNPRSEAAARAHTPPGTAIEWITGDYADLAGQGWDVVLSSLVAHHMTHDQLVAFLRFMDAEARAGWLVNDLHRHGFAHAGFPILARLFGWHRIVRLDGTLSIARSYRPAEWPPLLAEAGIEGARVYRAFPFRLCVERLR